MLSFFSKEEFPECKRQIREFVTRAGRVADVELEGPGASGLTHSEMRTIQIYVCRNNGVSARLNRFGGHSAEKTLSVEVLDDRGELAGRVVAKVGTRGRVERESSKFRTMAGRLPPELIVTQAGVVDTGAGRLAGAFYGLADHFDRDLFECLSGAEDTACSVLNALQQNFEALHQSGNHERKRFSMLRRDIVGSDRIENADELEQQIRQLDDLEVSISSCMQHGDLHGENILVDRNGVPLLIDYAKTAAASGCLDPLTLELSVVFHPGAQASRGGWPSEQQMSQWRDLDVYLDGCPFPDFIRLARGWVEAVASSESEVDAIALGYALRQLRYSPEIWTLAKALTAAAGQRLAGD